MHLNLELSKIKQPEELNLPNFFLSQVHRYFRQESLHHIVPRKVLLRKQRYIESSKKMLELE